MTEMRMTVGKLKKKLDEIEEGLDEILSICIGADSPDAQKNAKENPEDELSKCQKDLSAISDISERLLELFKGEQND